MDALSVSCWLSASNFQGAESGIKKKVEICKACATVEVEGAITG